MRANRHEQKRMVLVPMAEKATAGQVVGLEKDKLAHLKRVLRMDWDEPIHVTDGLGRLFDARLIQRGETGAVQLESLIRTENQALETELVICLAKNATMDWVVEKAVECGVTRIVPVMSSRSVVRPDPKETVKYARRWQAIMDGAVEQCERVWRPLVDVPVEWKTFVCQPNQDQVRIGFISELRAELATEADEKNAVEKCCSELARASGKSASILIGPEGGLASEERTDLVNAGWVEVSLGATVLRVETAVVAALSLRRVSRFISGA